MTVCANCGTENPAGKKFCGDCGQRRSDEADPLLAEAAEAFGRIQATPWLERVQALGAARGEEVPA